MPTELLEFRSFLDRRIAMGEDGLSPEETVALWRESKAALAESVEDIRQAIAEHEAGDAGRPLQQVVDELRRKHQIPADA